jgi:hypothetical protein
MTVSTLLSISKNWGFISSKMGSVALKPLEKLLRNLSSHRRVSVSSAYWVEAGRRDW